MSPSKPGVWRQAQEQLKRLWRSLGPEPASPRTPSERRYNLALALGSGGLRGAAHVGVLSVLEEEGLKPDILAGTSAGSVVACLYAAGYNSERMQELMDQLTADLFTDLTMPRFQLLVAGISVLRDYLGTESRRSSRAPSGLIKGERFREWLQVFLGDRTFEDLLIPTYAVATDLVSGEAVVFGSRDFVPVLPPGYVYITGVSVVDAVRASCSIPFVFQPMELKGRWLIDGAFADPVPVRLFSQTDIEQVIAVDLAVPPRVQEDEDSGDFNLFQVLSRGTTLITDRYAAETLPRYADLIIRPCEFKAKLTDTEQAETFVEQGRRATEQALQQWRRSSA